MKPSSTGADKKVMEQQNAFSTQSFIHMIKNSVEANISRPVKMLINNSFVDMNNNEHHNHEQSTETNKKSTDLTNFNINTDKLSREPSNVNRNLSKYRIQQFQKILDSDSIDLYALRKLSWNGIPTQYRLLIWQLLLGYMPLIKERRQATIERKRNEYFNSIKSYFTVSDADRTTQDGETLRQILVDLPRTCPGNPFFHQEPIRKAMERILYIWAIRHPASGYVQGMNDLLTPLLLVFTEQYATDPSRCDVATISKENLANIEADAFWCFGKLLDNIQDHYTCSQPGLQRMVMRLEDLIIRLDKELHMHFMDEGIQYMQFGFRWMNCALLRELPLRAIIRLWDTYFSEDQGGFENFHVYVCVVLLKMFREQLLAMDFQSILGFMQDLPTADWAEDEVEPILSQAFILSTLFENSPSHLS